MEQTSKSRPASLTECKREFQGKQKENPWVVLDSNFELQELLTCLLWEEERKLRMAEEKKNEWNFLSGLEQ